MARPRSTGLTDGELRVMNVLWKHGRATVADVIDALEGPRKPAYNSVLTILRILERKGYVGHEQERRAFTFIPLVDRVRERQRVLSRILKNLFDDSPGQLVSDLLGHDGIDAAELRRVRELVGQAPADARRGRARRSAR